MIRRFAQGNILLLALAFKLLFGCGSAHSGDRNGGSSDDANGDGTSSPTATPTGLPTKDTIPTPVTNLTATPTPQPTPAAGTLAWRNLFRLNSVGGGPYTSVSLPDGKIVVAGDGCCSPSTGLVFAVARLSASGSLDSGFGNSGIKSFLPRSAIRGSLYGLATQLDGKIIGVGVIQLNSAGDYLFAITRLNSDGTVDTTFGSSGYVSTSFVAGQYNIAKSAAVQSDGKILVVGSTTDIISINGATTEVVFRLNSDGTLDTTFGTGGKTNVASASATSVTPVLLVLESTGNLLVGGSNFVARLNSSGTMQSLAQPCSVSGITEQGDGKIVLACGSTVMRLGSDFSADSTFGSGGTVTIDSKGVASDGTGKVLVSRGSTVSRLNGNGSLDTGFANAGSYTAVEATAENGITYPFSMSSPSLLVQSNGGVVVSGRGSASLPGQLVNDYWWVFKLY